MMRPLRKLCRLLREEAGVVFIEMAFVMPVLILIVTGGTELARYVLLNQKLDRVASTMSDLTSQAETLSTTQLTALFDAVNQVGQPFDITAAGKIYVSSVTGKSGGTAHVNWQQSSGTLSVSSSIGTAGNNATLPSGFTLAVDETVIIGEVFYSYTPLIFNGVVENTQLHHTALFRPRFGTLTSLN